jgi:hypothetical protein
LRAFLTSVLVSHSKRNWLAWFRNVAKVRVKTPEAQLTKTGSTQAASTEPAK